MSCSIYFGDVCINDRPWQEGLCPAICKASDFMVCWVQAIANDPPNHLTWESGVVTIASGALYEQHTALARIVYGLCALKGEIEDYQQT